MWKSQKLKHLDITIEDNLQSYFFERLEMFNKSLERPLGQEIIYYSAHVLYRYSDTHEYFEVDENGVKEKVLGIRLLELQHLSRGERKNGLKDIGDTSLCLLGVFSDSVQKKIIDESYYSNLGRTAYSQLNNLEPNYLDIPGFYKNLAREFGSVVSALSLFTRDFFNRESPLLIKKVSNS